MDKNNTRTLDIIRGTPLILPGNQRALELVRIGHSLADWDFKPAGCFRIQNTYKISEPSAIELCYWGCPGVYGWAFLKPALGACIPQGRFVTWWRAAKGIDQPLDNFFRAQALPTNGLSANCYYWHLNLAWASLTRRTNGIDTDLGGGAINPPFTPETWAHYRYTWYEYLDTGLNRVLRCIFEKEVAGTWTVMVTIDDPTNAWADSAVNRVGFSAASWNYAPLGIYDDTEIWKKAV